MTVAVFFEHFEFDSSDTFVVGVEVCELHVEVVFVLGWEVADF